MWVNRFSIDSKSISCKLNMNINVIKKRLLHYTWELAYGDYDEQIVRQGLLGAKIHLIKNPYKKKWLADPFILVDNSSELNLLVEEFDMDVNRGRIAHLVIDKKTDEIKNCIIILDLPTHLSFPAIYRVGTEVYVNPENSRSGKSFIYRYDRTAEMLVDPICICEEPIADAIIVRNENCYEMYATREPMPNGNILVRYKSDDLTGPYKEYSQLYYKSNVARMAGAFLKMGSSLVRVAQDCNGAYGRAVFFMDGEHMISELRPRGYKFAGIHTFNTLDNTFVIDLKKYDYSLLYYLKTIGKR